MDSGSGLLKTQYFDPGRHAQTEEIDAKQNNLGSYSPCERPRRPFSRVWIQGQVYSKPKTLNSGRHAQTEEIEAKQADLVGLREQAARQAGQLRTAREKLAKVRAWVMLLTHPTVASLPSVGGILGFGVWRCRSSWLMLFVCQEAAWPATQDVPDMCAGLGGCTRVSFASLTEQLQLLPEQWWQLWVRRQSLCCPAGKSGEAAILRT